MNDPYPGNAKIALNLASPQVEAAMLQGPQVAEALSPSR